MSKRSGKSSLGRAIIRDRFKKSGRPADSWLHTTDLDDGSDGKRNMNSITEQKSIAEWALNAELANQQFTAEKLNLNLVANGAGMVSVEEESQQKKLHETFKDQLKIPRRPHWDENTTAEELDLMERDEFLNWRRSLALMAENQKLILTPYERNIEVWRQLWRVIEKSDAIVQIVDARNPLFFRCEDLEVYSKEVDKDKQNILLLNKADFLTFEQRQIWADYFEKQGVTAVFWSAAAELARMKEKTEVCDEESDNVSETSEGHDCEKNSAKILNVDELVELFSSVQLNCSNKTGIRSIGLVGYPNVGKSSTINALLTRKEQIAAENDEKTKHLQAPVSATPGKTKHFQTFFLNKSLLLCDCPGLVMPSFVSSKEQMMTSGVLPIDNMTDCLAPTSIVCKHIPRKVLESTYGIMLPVPTDEVYPDRNPTAYELLSAYARIRGFMSHKGMPDVQRASRFVLKDYVNGKLCYCHSPPGISEEVYGSKPTAIAEKPRNEKSNDASAEVHESGETAAFRFDQLVHEVTKPMKQVKPQYGIRGNVQIEGLDKSSATHLPSKRHGNANRKEKLRRVYADLDA